MQSFNTHNDANSDLTSYINMAVIQQIKWSAISAAFFHFRGRPPISWTDDIKKVSGQGMKGATQLTGERVAWRALVKATAALYSAT